jgi:hypothetical protein
LAENQPGSKLSLRRFAALAKVDRATAKKYLDVWERAAADGLVPPAASLLPGTHVDLSHLHANQWSHYHSVRPAAGVDWAEEALRALEGTRHYSPEPHDQLARYVAAMRKLPPTHPEGCWSPDWADRWAGALGKALGRVRPSELSDPQGLAAQLRKEADRLEAAAPEEEGGR